MGPWKFVRYNREIIITVIVTTGFDCSTVFCTSHKTHLNQVGVLWTKKRLSDTVTDKDTPQIQSLSIFLYVSLFPLFLSFRFLSFFSPNVIFYSLFSKLPPFFLFRFHSLYCPQKYKINRGSYRRPSLFAVLVFAVLTIRGRKNRE